MTDSDRFLRLEQVSALTGLPCSTIRRKVVERVFPRPIKISPRLNGWIESEVREWMQARIAERDGKEASYAEAA